MMTQIRLMKIMRSVNVLNVLLLAVIIALAAYILPPLLKVNVSYPLPAPKKVAQEKGAEPSVPQPPSAMEYVIIAEQNVFNPARKIPAEKTEEKPLPKPEFVLYGTLITGDTGMAFIEDLKAAPAAAGSRKRQRTLRVGGVLSGFTLKQVDTDRVILVRGEEKMEVKVMDSHKRTRDTNTEAAGVQVQAPPARPLSSTSQAAPGPSRRSRPQRTPGQGPPPASPPAS